VLANHVPVFCARCFRFDKSLSIQANNTARKAYHTLLLLILLCLNPSVIFDVFWLSYCAHGKLPKQITRLFQRKNWKNISSNRQASCYQPICARIDSNLPWKKRRDLENTPKCPWIQKSLDKGWSKDRSKRSDRLCLFSFLFLMSRHSGSPP
jgi:hypothetical protein